MTLSVDAARVLDKGTKGGPAQSPCFVLSLLFSRGRSRVRCVRLHLYVYCGCARPPPFALLSLSCCLLFAVSLESSSLTTTGTTTIPSCVHTCVCACVRVCVCVYIPRLPGPLQKILTVRACSLVCPLVCVAECGKKRGFVVSWYACLYE